MTGRALVTSLDDRLYLVDVGKMELDGEVGVPGDYGISRLFREADSSPSTTTGSATRS